MFQKHDGVKTLENIYYDGYISAIRKELADHDSQIIMPSQEEEQKVIEIHKVCPIIVEKMSAKELITMVRNQ